MHALQRGLTPAAEAWSGRPADPRPTECGSPSAGLGVPPRVGLAPQGSEAGPRGMSPHCHLVVAARALGSSGHLGHVWLLQAQVWSLTLALAQMLPSPPASPAWGTVIQKLLGRTQEPLEPTGWERPDPPHEEAPPRRDPIPVVTAPRTFSLRVAAPSPVDGARVWGVGVTSLWPTGQRVGPGWALAGRAGGAAGLVSENRD